MLDAQRLVCADVLSSLSCQPTLDLANGLRVGRREAEGVAQRADVAKQVPALSDALEAGQIQAAHLDHLDRSLRRLTPSQRQQLLGESASLLEVAKVSTPPEFDRHLRQRERAISADHGEAQFERQQRLTRLRSWVSADDGMHIFKLAVDPFTGARLTQRINDAAEQLFHGGSLPEHAPDDSSERNAFLRAHALLDLIASQSGGAGAPEIVVVVDTRVPAGAHAVVDCGSDTQLPPSVIDKLAENARIVVVGVDGGDVVTAPGRRDLGRSQRLASESQRRMLRALYVSCAVPGCEVPFDHTTGHHVRFWRPPLLGPTDLANLLPLCIQHHQQVHKEGWSLDLHPDRSLDVYLPDGTVMHGVPNRAARTESIAHSELGEPTPP